MKNKIERHSFRKLRTRKKILASANGLPRLAVHRSLKYIYAQVIDDAKGRTLAAASSFKKGLKSGAKSMDAAKALGTEIAKKAVKAGVSKVVFDRGGSKYHGRVKALAEAAREAGLKF